jgi:hypothetical protein
MKHEKEMNGRKEGEYTWLGVESKTRITTDCLDDEGSRLQYNLNGIVFFFVPRVHLQRSRRWSGSYRLA